ncbi:ShlB/FhaC/HecB family hemolysin secretion/activation protein [Methylotenera sp. G11]|uniref:ShlB/FhaC/HecB family hemolysin secretion/activation protein n=1 Tax=Methylotenera sp. G11 TaxID=1506585 RepID=UPI0006490A15|nr:ShlB/FhaC/HecB family hemolysin secretion/activation protein [Methylotenera sp. G11]
MSTEEKISTRWLLLVAGIASAGFSAGVQAASPQPDAGQVTRELQQGQRLQAAPKELSSPEPLATETEVPSTALMADDTAIAVTRVHVTGAEKFPARVLQALVADLAVGTHTLSQLEAGAARITAYYRKRGYFLANAYIPEQDINNGILNIAVQEGALDQVKLKNSSRVSDGRILGHLKHLNTGDALQKPAIDRQLLLLRGTVGVDNVNASLQGGNKAGTSDLLVETTPSAPYSGRIQLSNHGNRYTGEYQLGVTLNVNSPLKLGDQLTMWGVGSSGDLLYGRVAYQVPVGGDGLRIGASYSRNRYLLGREFESLDAGGRSETASLFATYPLMLSQTSALFGVLTYENKKLNDRMDAVFTDTDKRVQLVSAGLNGERQDTVYGGGRNSFDAVMYAGHLNMDAASRLIDEGSARSNGDFVKATYMLNRLQRVTDQDTFSMTLSGQWAGSNLNSSEKFSLGGAYGVRAYPQGEASGDEGNLLNLELVHYFTPKFRGVLFYDYGNIRINRNDFLTTDNTRTLSGAGAGVNAALFGLQLNSYLAWPVQGGAPLSDPASSEHAPRLWVQMSGAF